MVHAVPPRIAVRLLTKGRENTSRPWTLLNKAVPFALTHPQQQFLGLVLCTNTRLITESPSGAA